LSVVSQPFCRSASQSPHHWVQLLTQAPAVHVELAFVPEQAAPAPQRQSVPEAQPSATAPHEPQEAPQWTALVELEPAHAPYWPAAQVESPTMQAGEAT
jgi:hypothetical protein